MALAFLLVLALLDGRAAFAQEENGPASRAKLDEAFASTLKDLAKRCDELQRPDLAKEAREWLIARDPDRTYLFLPEQSVAAKPANEAKPPKDEPREEAIARHFRRRFMAARKEQADGLVKLAEKAIATGEADQAYRWLNEALREDPDQAIARRALGYRLVNGRWRLPQGQPRAAQGKAPQRLLGFLPRRHWRVESEHFLLLTDHSSRAGIDAVRGLEDTYALWRQVFFDYWSNGAQLKQRMESTGAPRRSLRKYSVVLFRDREKYLSVVAANQPQLAKTVGIYDDKKRTAYFYVGGDNTLATRNHEATHQFFSESTGRTENVGVRHNFWVVEAVALYMESLQDHNGYYTVGGRDDNRTQFARYRAYNERFYMPLDELTTLSRSQLQSHDELRRLYSQSAGIAGYLLNRAGRPRRAAFLEYVRDVYQKRSDEKSLQTRLQDELKNVDREYLLSLGVSDAHVLSWPHRKLSNLSLGHTQVTDRSLIALGDQPKLRWLDLAFTKVSDNSCEWLSGCSGLEQLNLESTKITDGSLAQLAKIRSLVELDLSGTSITGKTLGQLAPLKNLKILWLSNTEVDDAAIESLKSLKQLERLQIDGTNVTRAGLQRLRSALPNLQE